MHGAQLLAQQCDAVIIVDILSFTTAVTIAVSRGGVVFPYRSKDELCIDFAQQNDAILAGPRESGSYSLSPSSLCELQSGQRIVLLSPNGSTLSLATGDVPTYAGCLRNAKAVAEKAQSHGSVIGVVPCDERWRDDGSLRPAVEDWLGAGAIIHHLTGNKSPEAQSAEWAFQQAQSTLFDTLRDSASGRELFEMGFENDVKLASDLNVSKVAARLIDKAYQDE